jgi:hypothetical protein
MSRRWKIRMHLFNVEARGLNFLFKKGGGRASDGELRCQRAVDEIKLLLPPCRIIGQLHILRPTLTFNFNQENIRYII